MEPLEGNLLLQAVGRRVICRYLTLAGIQVSETPGPQGEGEAGEIACSRAGRPYRVRVKSDPYCGVDPVKIADRDLAFYRKQGTDYAFEAISHHLTRQLGWMFNSEAEELYYYFIALGQTEEEIAALMQGSDEVFFSELRVERDELHIMPMSALRDWFERNYEHYTPRPVLVGDHSAWYRIVPRDELRRAIAVDVVGPVFSFTVR